MLRKTSTFSFSLLGKSIPQITDGKLAARENSPQRITKVLLEKRDYHLKKTSVTHQKLGTLSW